MGNNCLFCRSKYCISEDSACTTLLCIDSRIFLSFEKIYFWRMKYIFSEEVLWTQEMRVQTPHFEGLRPSFHHLLGLCAVSISSFTGLLDTLNTGKFHTEFIPIHREKKEEIVNGKEEEQVRKFGGFLRGLPSRENIFNSLKPHFPLMGFVLWVQKMKV